MENKLQELTQKLYEEGLSKGKQEAEQMVADARKQAEKIVADARKQADELRKQAEKSAEDLKKNTLTELGLAGRQMVGTLKSQIESLIVFKSTSDAVSAANADPEFIKSLLLEIASHWNGASSSRVDLKAVLPADKQAALEKCWPPPPRTTSMPTWKSHSIIKSNRASKSVPKTAVITSALPMPISRRC